MSFGRISSRSDCDSINMNFCKWTCVTCELTLVVCVQTAGCCGTTSTSSCQTAGTRTTSAGRIQKVKSSASWTPTAWPGCGGTTRWAHFLRDRQKKLWRLRWWRTNQIMWDYNQSSGQNDKFHFFFFFYFYFFLKKSHQTLRVFKLALNKKRQKILKSSTTDFFFFNSNVWKEPDFTD